MILGTVLTVAVVLLAALTALLGPHRGGHGGAVGMTTFVGPLMSKHGSDDSDSDGSSDDSGDSGGNHGRTKHGGDSDSADGDSDSGGDSGSGDSDSSGGSSGDSSSGSSGGSDAASSVADPTGPTSPLGPGLTPAAQAPSTGSQPIQPVPAQSAPLQSAPAQLAPAQSVPPIQNSNPAIVPTPSGTDGGTALDAPAGNQVSSVSPVPLAQGSGGPVKVTDSVSLDAALANAKPGQTIELADGTYNGRFTIDKAGQQGNPITLHGSSKAIINGGDTSGGYTLHLDGASFWQLAGFTVAGGQKGIMTDRTNSTIMSGLDVGNTGEEGVHMGDFSSNNVLQNSVVHDTGKFQPGFGEGLYLGTAQSNWAKKSNGQPDRSNDNRAIDNTFKNTTAENIDVKEDTNGGLIAGNSFDGSGLSGVNFADSVMDLKGNGYRIMNNITSGAGPHLKNGFQTHVITDPADSGCGNTFLNNVFNVQLSGPLILLDGKC